MAVLRNMICKFEANNKEIITGTGYHDVYKAAVIEGLTGLEFDFTAATSPQLAGAIFTNKRPLPRIITFQIDCPAELREGVISFFNPFHKGKLTMTWQGVTRWIEYIPHPVKVVQNNIYHELGLDIQIVCEQPYFLDMDDFGKDIAAKQPLLAFPFVIAAPRNLMAAYRLMTFKVPITNAGDVAASVRVVFYANGEAINPKFILNDTQHIRVITTMQQGDTLVFDTDPSNIHVTQNADNVLNKIDPTSSFFQIPMGESFISYDADDGAINLSVTVYYRPKYLGV